MRSGKWFGILLSVSIVLTGCGMEYGSEVSTAENTVSTTVKVYFTGAEKKRYDALSLLYGTAETAAVQEQMPEFVKETKNGKVYYTMTQTETVKGDELAESAMVLDEDKFIIYNSLPGNINAGTITSLPGYEEPEFFSMEYSFDKPVLSTNGTLEGDKKITFSDFGTWEQSVIYACFTEKAANCRKVQADVSRYTKKGKVSFSTDGVITDMTVNGEKYTPDYYGVTYKEDHTLAITELKRDYYDFSSEKTYKIGVTLSSGYHKNFTFTYDKTAPEIVYKSKKIKVTDKNGVKKITLNGKKIKNGKKVTKKGSYKVKAWDQAGNVKTYQFKVKS